MSSIQIDDIYHSELEGLLFYRRSMDMTRNLSVIALTGMILFTFGFPLTSSHLIFIFGWLILFLFQIFEARTSQYAETAAYRLRLIEQNQWVPELDQATEPEEGWRKKLAASISSNEPVMNYFDAFCGRIWKGYYLIFLCLEICWFSRVYIFPGPAASWQEFVSRQVFGFLPNLSFIIFPTVFWIVYTIFIIIYRKKYKNKITDF